MTAEQDRKPASEVATLFKAVMNGLPKLVSVVEDGKTFVGYAGGVMVCDRPNTNSTGYRPAAASLRK